jgi:hypothetical protein
VHCTVLALGFGIERALLEPSACIVDQVVALGTWPRSAGIVMMLAIDLDEAFEDLHLALHDLVIP